MSKTKKTIIATLIVALIMPSAWAHVKNEMGERIAKTGSNNLPACAVCHGEHGQGDIKVGYPRLAGMNAAYLDQQLNLYAQDLRQNLVMKDYAQKLSVEERRAVSAYYARQQANPPHVYL